MLKRDLNRPQVAYETVLLTSIVLQLLAVKGERGGRGEERKGEERRERERREEEKGERKSVNIGEERQ